MLRQKNYLALGVLGCILLLSATTADNSVHILSKYGHQPLTSTTLKWLPVAHYNPSESKEIVIGGVENVLDGEGATNDTLVTIRRSRVQTGRTRAKGGLFYDEPLCPDGAARIYRKLFPQVFTRVRSLDPAGSAPLIVRRDITSELFTLHSKVKTLGDAR